MGCILPFSVALTREKRRRATQPTSTSLRAANLKDETRPRRDLDRLDAFMVLISCFVDARGAFSGFFSCCTSMRQRLLPYRCCCCWANLPVDATDNWLLDVLQHKIYALLLCYINIISTATDCSACSMV